MNEVSQFFNFSISKVTIEDKSKKKSNVGNKNSVFKSTLQLLDNFFKPYNKRLADLLGDEKWLFTKDRSVN